MCYFSEHIVLSILQKFWQSNENQESCRDFVTPTPKIRKLAVQYQYWDFSLHNWFVWHLTIGNTSKLRNTKEQINLLED